MKIKSKIILSLLMLSVCTSNVHANPLTFMKKHPVLAATVGVGTVVYLKSTIHKARKLSFNPHEVDTYFQTNPQDFNPIAKYVLHALEHPANKKDYDRYKVLADLMGLDQIPPYIPTAHHQPTILENPQNQPLDNSFETPIVQPGKDSNIIYTPEGKRIDTSTEFPNQRINSWNDYIYAKTQAQILADNMEAAGAGKKPAGYAAHHIVAWDDNRYPECQDLRNLLSSSGIDINDPANGVYLPTRRTTKNSNEAYHPEIHTRDYYRKVYNTLKFSNGNPMVLRTLLIQISSDLKSNKF